MAQERLSPGRFVQTPFSRTKIPCRYPGQSVSGEIIKQQILSTFYFFFGAATPFFSCRHRRIASRRRERPTPPKKEVPLSTANNNNESATLAAVINPKVVVEGLFNIVATCVKNELLLRGSSTLTFIFLYHLYWPTFNPDVVLTHRCFSNLSNRTRLT